jgi:flagellar protein FliS
MLNTMPNGNSYDTYKQAAVNTASPEKLLIMLFNGGIKFIHLADQAIEAKDYTTADKMLLRIQDILMELILTLDMNQGDISKNLRRLYEFYHHEVVQTNLYKDAKRLGPVLEFFMLYRDTWVEVAKKARLGTK